MSPARASAARGARVSPRVARLWPEEQAAANRAPSGAPATNDRATSVPSARAALRLLGNRLHQPIHVGDLQQPDSDITVVAVGGQASSAHEAVERHLADDKPHLRLRNP